LYQLAGIVIHSGSANGGHYYSYIRERGKKDPRWLEFNDKTVREFDFKDLAKECFGTPAGDKKKKSNATNSYYGFDTEWERHANAYVLLYEKVNKTTEESTPTNVPAPQKSVDPSGLPLVDNQEVNEELDA